MVKTLISILCVIVLLTGAVIYETKFIPRQFNEFIEILNVLEEKCENETANEADILAAQKNWLDKKKYLHVFIPHTEIKEVDLWLSELVRFTKNGNYEESLTKIEVLRELCEQIPKTFDVRMENIL